jgi:hypothetical protein
LRLLRAARTAFVDFAVAVVIRGGAHPADLRHDGDGVLTGGLAAFDAADRSGATSPGALEDAVVVLVGAAPVARWVARRGERLVREPIAVVVEIVACLFCGFTECRAQHRSVAAGGRSVPTDAELSGVAGRGNILVGRPVAVLVVAVAAVDCGG